MSTDRYTFDDSRPLRILVVEDNPEDAELTIRSIMNAPNLWSEVSLVRSLAEAKNFLQQHHTHLILLDLELPNGKGLQSLREVKRAPTQAPIVIITGADSEEDAIRAIAEEGAQSYIPKHKLQSENAGRILRFSVARDAYMKRLLEAQRDMYIENAHKIATTGGLADDGGHRL